MRIINFLLNSSLKFLTITAICATISPNAQAQVPGCSLANEAEYIYGSYSINWSYAGLRHEGSLVMYGGIGVMRINFYNDRLQGTDSVEETMVLANCTQGLILLGFNPVVPGTNSSHPSYFADNIIVRRNVDGSIDLVNCDDQGLCLRVEIEQTN